MQDPAILEPKGDPDSTKEEEESQPPTLSSKQEWSSASQCLSHGFFLSLCLICSDLSCLRWTLNNQVVTLCLSGDALGEAYSLLPAGIGYLSVSPSIQGQAVLEQRSHGKSGSSALHETLPAFPVIHFDWTDRIMIWKNTDLNSYALFWFFSKQMQWNSSLLSAFSCILNYTVFKKKKKILVTLSQQW